jgi:hypothetical protein
MKQQFYGGRIYSKYNRATNEFSAFLRKIDEPIEFDVIHLHKWLADNGKMQNAWELDLGEAGKVYIWSETISGSGDQYKPDEAGGLFSGDGWNLDFECLNQEQPILERIKCFIKKAWKLILVIVGLLLLLKNRKK